MNEFFNNSNSHQRKDQSTGFIVGIILCCLLAGCFAMRYLLHSGRESRIMLNEKINPNTACVPSLVRLPNIGVSRAEAIISYRQRFRQTGKDRRAFEDCNDLQEVRGIGQKTAEGISKWLDFERNVILETAEYGRMGD